MWIAFVIGVVIGAFAVVGVIFEGYEVHKKDWWEVQWQESRAFRSLVDKLTAENAKLRVALGAGEMTQDGNIGAAMTMAALDAVNSAGNGATNSPKEKA